MKPIVFASGVRDEIDLALLLSPQPGLFRIAIDIALRGIQANPQIAAKITRSGVRHLHMVGYPCGIVYADEPTIIRVVAFAHGRRKPGYWKKRLRKP